MCDPLGLLIYILLLLLVFIAGSTHNNLMKWFLLGSVAVVAAFRGSAGVDTNLYLIRFQNASEVPISFIEPTIPLLMNFTHFLDGNFIIFSLFLGLILSFLYFKILKGFPNSIYFALTIFPVIYIDSLFNGIRVGLAYPLILLAIADKKKLSMGLAILTHISSAAIVPFLFRKKWRVFSILALLIFFAIYDMSALYNMTSERYQSKFDFYSEMDTKNPYSGIADSLALLFGTYLLFKVKKFTGSRLRKYTLCSIGFIFTIHIFLISEFYFMLRVVRILIIAVFGLILREERFESKKLTFTAVFFGCLYTINFIRQIISTCEYDDGGFLPLTL